MLAKRIAGSVKNQKWKTANALNRHPRRLWKRDRSLKQLLWAKRLKKKKKNRREGIHTH